MKNLKWSQLNMILGLLLVAGVAFAVLGFVFGKEHWELPEMDEVREMNDAWIVRVDDLYDQSTNLPCNLETLKGEPATISHYLPEDITSDSALAFYAVYNAVQVKLGEEIIYQYGVSDKQPFVKSPVPKWVLIPLDESYAGRLVTITQISEYGTYAGMFTEVEVGSRSALLYRHWLRDGWGVILSVVFALLIVGLCVVSFFSGLHKQVDYRLYYFIVLSVMTLLWCVSGCSVIRMQSDEAFGIWLVHILCHMLIPVIYLIFIRGFVQKKRLVMMIDIGIILSAILAVTASVLQVLKLLEFSLSYEITRIAYMVGFAGLTVLIAYDYFARKKEDLRNVTFAQIGLCIAGAANIFLRPNHLYQQEGIFWPIAVMVYMFILLGIMVSILLQQVDEKVHMVEEGYDNQRALAVSMMNPNFIFSSLNTLLTMTKQGATQSPRMVFSLSKYLRSNLDFVREEKMVPFEEELSHIAAYLEIQQLRIPGLSAQVEDKCHDFSVPNKTIEAIVENAVRHGMEKHNKQGRVIVRSYERRDSYAIQIIDEGVGFDTDMLYRKETPTSMKTVRDRLQKTIGAKVEVSSKLGTGTIVTVKVPKKKPAKTE